MSKFTELSAKDMNETNGGFVTVVPVLIAGLAYAGYTIYQAVKK